MKKSKDFTDWNGRKRKETLSPSREKVTRQGPHLREKRAGIKTKSDRYKALGMELKKYWGYRRRQRRRPEPGFWWRWEDDVRSTLKKLRTMKSDYKKEGIWERVKEILGL